MVMRFVSFGLLAGCSMGANPETLIDELRVVAIVLEPPEAAPGEPVTVTTHLSDPTGVGAHAGAWTCLGFFGECLEQDPNRLVTTTELGSQITWTLTAPVEAAGILAKSEEAAASIWSMACEDGVCPLLEEDTPCAEDLADPYTMMTDLPLDGVSLARRSLWMSNRPLEERMQNPTVTADFSEPPVVSPEDSEDLCFSVEGATDAYGYASAGGFSETEVGVEDGQLTLQYTAPEDATEVDLWVVVQSDDGGAAVWTGSLVVE